MTKMVHESEGDDERMRMHVMFIEENRVKSFKDWVFDRCECTPKKVLSKEAGSKLGAGGEVHHPTY